MKRKIKVSGTLIPAHEGSEVLVTLFKKKGGFRQVKQVAATVNAEGRFGAAFKVPNAKRCRVTATWESDGDHLGSSAKTTFSC